MTSSSSEYEEFSDSWSSSEPSSFDLPWKKQAEKEKSPTVEVLASGVTFLLPAQSPLTRNLKPRRSKIVLPNVDPKTLARLIQHQLSAETPLEIQKNECVSLLRLAIVFGLEDILQRTRKQVLATIKGQEGHMAGFWSVVNRLNSRMMVDDAFLTILDHVLNSLQDIPHFDQDRDQQPLQDTLRPALTTLSRLREGRLIHPSVSAPTRVEPEQLKRSRFNPFDMLIRPKKTFKKLGAVEKSPNSKKTGAVSVPASFKKPGSAPVSQNSKNTGAVPMQNSKNPSAVPNQISKKLKTEVVTPNSKGPMIAEMQKANGIQKGQLKMSQNKGEIQEKKNPLALSVIRKIPRTKPH